MSRRELGVLGVLSIIYAPEDIIDDDEHIGQRVASTEKEGMNAKQNDDDSGGRRRAPGLYPSCLDAVVRRQAPRGTKGWNGVADSERGNPATARKARSAEWIATAPEP